MYLSEIRELIDSLRFRIQQLQQARDSWLAHESVASIEAAADTEGFNHEAFAQALNAGAQQQTSIFDAFEALLAAWARLSLLLHPAGGKDALADWRAARGEALCHILQLPADTLLASRSFRDSWMHFDERLDAAVVEGWLGNRQRFVKTAAVAAAVTNTVRVIDIEALAFHYRTRTGQQEHVTTDEMLACLDFLRMEPSEVGPRVVLLPPPA
ncbi:MAG TPA: hypothetical protein VGD77_17975 [Gemmatimonadaceae bacterium]